MSFAEITPTPHTADGPFWQQPEGTHGDHLDSDPPTGDLANGGSYGGIPQAFNGVFSEHEDAPPNSIPIAMAPAAQAIISVVEPPQAPVKDND